MTDQEWKEGKISFHVSCFEWAQGNGEQYYRLVQDPERTESADPLYLFWKA